MRHAAPRVRARRFDLIAFDWDGTLFDSTALIVRCIQNACRELGVSVPSDERAAYVIGLGLRDALMHAAPELAPERYAELGMAYRRHYLASQHEVVLFPGTLPMLQALRGRNHLLAVATGKSRRGLDEALTSTELQGLFHATRTADETSSKPHPQMLLELMAELGIEAARTLMIGDTTHDLQMAANAGVPAVGVSFGAHDHESFASFEPLFIAHSVPQLHAWLAEHG
jgi:phosphoglycolate phosphatase